MQKENKVLNTQQHKYHLVNSSPWPILTAFSALFFTFGMVLYMHGYAGGVSLTFLGFSLILFLLTVWWRDVFREGRFEGLHTLAVERGLTLGFLLFLVSEIMFFFAFFWAFFHSSVAPTAAIGAVWPPLYMPSIDYQLPLTNTIILLTSSCTLTWAHQAVESGAKDSAETALYLTVFLATLFLGLQYFEFIESQLTISSGVFGSTFYMCTGFHGAHVIIGTIFLIVSTIRLSKDHSSTQSHLGYVASVWYWHFVDVVWLFVFGALYLWGGI